MKKEATKISELLDLIRANKDFNNLHIEDQRAIFTANDKINYFLANIDESIDENNKGIETTTQFSNESDQGELLELNELVCTFEELIRGKIKDEKLIYFLKRKYFNQVFSETEENSPKIR